MTTPTWETSQTEAPITTMAWLPGGAFRMGSDAFYPDEAPAHPVTVDGFRIDRYAVTNAQFARFVSATGYITVAERPLDPTLYPDARPELLIPGSLVFQQPAGLVSLHDARAWWEFVPGASWQHPEGQGSTLDGREQHPVVHVAYEDATAFAKWVGKDLPTEAEWEYAARGGIEGATYVWGDAFMPEGQIMANTWHGQFPWQNLTPHGFHGTAPVGSFPANGYGLFDMAGNVWEWTTDWYQPRHTAPAAHACCIPLNPRGATETQSYDPTDATRIPRKVLKGGSYLCAPNYCLRYRPAARSPEMIDSAACHIGFRCVARPSRGGR